MGLGDTQTDLLIAWKRIYLERDNMYKDGATLTAAHTPNGDASNDTITVDNAYDFRTTGPNSLITIFGQGGNSVDTYVISKTTTTITIPDLNTGFSKYDGVKIRSENDTYSAPDDYILMAYGMDPDGSDGGVFVEFVDTSGDESIPKYKNFPDNDEMSEFCLYWFDHPGISGKNCIQLVAGKAIYSGKLGMSNPGLNRSIIYNDAHTGTNKDKKLKDTVVHELGHQFDVSGAHVDSNDHHQNHLGAGHDDCIMTYATDDEDDESEFCTDCIGEVRREDEPL